MEHDLEEVEVAGATLNLPLYLKYAECCPSVDGRVDVAEIPLVRRDFSISLHVPVTRE